MNFRVFIINFCSLLFLIVHASHTSSIHALQAIKPVSPALAVRSIPARIYKGLTEHYRDILQLVETHWRIPTSEQPDPKSYVASEQAIELFFEHACKNSYTRSLDDYLAQLELDIQVLGNLEQMFDASTREVRALRPNMHSLRIALMYIHDLIHHHRFYHHCVQQLVTVQNFFTQEFTLLKNGELTTLTTHMRGNVTRHYYSDIAVTTERIKVSIALAQPRYPRLAQELMALLKSCERIREVYEKI